MTAPKKYTSGGPQLSDVAAWAQEYNDTSNLSVRWTWTRGAKPKEFKVTAQAYDVVDGKAHVVATVYDVWPSRSARTVEALMLNLLIKLQDVTGSVTLGAPAPDA